MESVVEKKFEKYPTFDRLITIPQNSFGISFL